MIYGRSPEMELMYGYGSREKVRSPPRKPRWQLDGYDTSKLVNGRFTTLADKVAHVKTWPGIKPADVDAAVALAAENGTIAAYEAAIKRAPDLDIVLTVHRSSVIATLEYVVERLIEVHGNVYMLRLYRTLFEGRGEARLIGREPFTPDRVTVEIVDLAANRYGQGSAGLRLQENHRDRLAGFSALYAAIQSPAWIRPTQHFAAPSVLVAGLQVTMSDHLDEDDTSVHGWIPTIDYREDDEHAHHDQLVLHLHDARWPRDASSTVPALRWNTP